MSRRACFINRLTVIVYIWLCGVLFGEFVCGLQRCTCDDVSLGTIPCGNNGRGTTAVCWNSPGNLFVCFDLCSTCYQCSLDDLRHPSTSLVSSLISDQCRLYADCDYTVLSTVRNYLGCKYVDWNITYSCSRPTSPFPYTSAPYDQTTTTTPAAVSRTVSIAAATRLNPVSISTTSTNTSVNYASTTLSTRLTSTAGPGNARNSAAAVVAGVVCGVGGTGIICAVVVFIVLCKRKQKRDRMAVETASNPSVVAQNVYAPFSINGTGNGLTGDNSEQSLSNDASSSSEVVNLSPPAAVYAVIKKKNDNHNYAQLAHKSHSGPSNDHAYGNILPVPATEAAALQTITSDGDYGGVTLVDNALYESSNIEGDYGGVTLVDNVIYK